MTTKSSLSFLRKKGLVNEFRRYRKYNRTYRFKYNAADVTKGGYLSKRGNQTVILDDKFRVIGKSKDSIKQIRNNSDSFKIKDVGDGRFERKYNYEFRRENKFIYNNKKVKTVTNKPKSSKLGKVGITLRAFKGNQRITVSGGSRALRDLSKSSSRKKALDEAERGAWGQIPFSPDKIEVVNIEYTYFGRS